MYLAQSGITHLHSNGKQAKVVKVTLLAFYKQMHKQAGLQAQYKHDRAVLVFFKNTN